MPWLLLTGVSILSLLPLRDFSPLLEFCICHYLFYFVFTFFPGMFATSSSILLLVFPDLPLRANGAVSTLIISHSSSSDSGLWHSLCVLNCYSSMKMFLHISHLNSFTISTLTLMSWILTVSSYSIVLRLFCKFEIWEAFVHSTVMKTLVKDHFLNTRLLCVLVTYDLLKISNINLNCIMIYFGIQNKVLCRKKTWKSLSA